jgi:hypothetical protein
MRLVLVGIFLIASQSRPGRFEGGSYTTCPDLQESLVQNTAYVEASESDLLRFAKSKPFAKCPVANCAGQDIKVWMEIRVENVFCATAENGPPEMQKAAVNAAMEMKFKKNKKHALSSNVVGTLHFKFN